jgi:23S rRNA pseudouridine2605 synthase
MKPLDHAGEGSRVSRAVGLARALSKLGYCSRSQATVLIRDGLVRLNGRVRRDPEAPVDLRGDRIAVSERSVTAREFVYLMLNKPRGVITTASDEKGRATVYNFLDQDVPWIAPVGRLDKASEGLLLLTNDSEWSARILAPQSHVEKVYRVQIRSADPDAVVGRLERGTESQGELLRVRRVSVLMRGRSNAWLEMVLHEGKNRHIRRMMEACGVEVLRLLRVSIGPLSLGSLAKGKVRELSSTEKLGLDDAIKARRARR